MAKRGAWSAAKKMPAKPAKVEKKPAKVISEEEGEDIDADLGNANVASNLGKMY